MNLKFNKKDLWIGVDLDGTLAEIDEYVSPTHIGEPIYPMIKRVKEWNAQGQKIKIFTARISRAWFTYVGNTKAMQIEPVIQEWCLKHLGFTPEITCEKDHLMIELWDDIKLRQVKRNTGEVICEMTTPFDSVDSVNSFEHYQGYEFCERGFGCVHLEERKCIANICYHSPKSFYNWLIAEGYQIVKEKK